MAYIYKITNDINDKVYIGKTLLPSVEERFLQHCREHNKTTEKHRPLYAAMRKYGAEHFKVEQIEECSIEEVDDRERYWIEQHRSFKYGYNATIGGDGRAYLDYDLVIKTYQQTLSIRKTSEVLNIDPGTVSRILKTAGSYSDEEIQLNKMKSLYHAVGKFDRETGALLEVYPSVAEAEKKNPTGNHIGQVCTGKRKSAGGFIWKYIQDG